MKTLAITVLFFMGFISSSAAELYAKLEVTYSTRKVADKAYEDLASYRWQSGQEAFAGELLVLSKKLEIDTELDGGFAEFHLISGILKRGWSLAAVETTPPHFAHADGLKFYRERTKVFHFTRPDPADDAPATKKGDQDDAGQAVAPSESDSEGGDKPEPEAEGRSR